MLTKEVLSEKFVSFAEKECKGSSLLYEYLSREISCDDELLDICEQARDGQPIPNLFLGAVHFLLLKGYDHPLKEYYPSIVSNPKPYQESFITFKEFCRENKNEIVLIIKTRLVQTNEVRRCTYLYPIFCAVFEKVKKPLALIEIGTSAGLQLLVDKYSYSYEGNEIYGADNSKLLLTGKIKGENTPILSKTPPPIAKRIGIDLNTIDLHDGDQRLWLKSLIWPEHKERLVMLENAASYIKEYPVHLVEGDGIGLLPNYVESISQDYVICIFHTHVANQMTLEMKKNLLNVVESIGKERDVFHIYNNIQDRYLHLDSFFNGEESNHTIAETDGHGRWFKWLLKNQI